MGEKWRKYGNFCHVCAVIILYCAGFGIYITIYQDFMRWKRCVEIFASDSSDINGVEEYCHDINHRSNASSGCSKHGNESLVQAEASRYGLYNLFCYNVPAIFTAVILGAWSETHGRKLPLLLSLAGATLSSLAGLLTATFTALPTYVFLMGSLLSGLTGGFLVTFMSVFAMVSDMSKDHITRTLYLGIASGCLTSGILVGTLVSAQIFLRTHDSYAWVFVAGQVASTVAALYTWIFVQETIETPNLKLSQELRQCGHIEHVKASFNTIAKPREGKKRLYLIVCLLTFLAYYGSDFGMPGLSILFLECILGWTPTQYSYYLATSTAAGSLGSFLLSVVLKKWFRLRDTGIILFGMSISAGKMLLFSLSYADWMVYMSASLSFFSFISYPAFRSFLSKQVEASEIGRVFAAIATVENIAPAISGAVFNNVFSATVGENAKLRMPGFAFILSTVFQFLCILVICWVHIDSFCVSRKCSKADEEAIVENENPVDIIQ